MTMAMSGQEAMPDPGAAIEPVSLQRRRILFAAVSTLCVAAVFYSIVTITEVEGSLGKIFTAMGLGLVALLVLLGTLQPEKAGSGIGEIALQLLPRVSGWATRSARVFWSVVLLMIVVATFAFWLGPASVRDVSVLCGDATRIQFGAGKTRDCKDSFAATLWFPPGAAASSEQLSCYNAVGDKWTATRSAGRCGARPRNAGYVRNGIPEPALDRNTVAGDRAWRGKEALAQALAKILPPRDKSDRLLVATWNLRAFGGRPLAGGATLPERDIYIAQILAHFDLVALQEIRSIAAARRLVKLMGPDYNIVFSPVAPGVQGNREMFAILYDTRKLATTGVASSIVVMGANLQQLASADPRRAATGQPARPPFIAEFDMGGRRFQLLTTHLFYGSSANPDRRLAEARDTFAFVAASARAAEAPVPVIFAGNINAASEMGPEVAALRDAGFELDPDLARNPSNAGRDHPYDQLAMFPAGETRFRFGDGGVFDYYDVVFRLADWKDYKADMPIRPGDAEGATDPARAFKMWRTFQMSDHLIKWTELRL
jgi:hypothetical protein